jgi:hypothetical protein
MILLVLLICIVYTMFFKLSITKQQQISTPSIENDGFKLYKSNFSINHTPLEKKDIVKRDLPKILDENYILLDYIYYIKGCSLSTFHRDVTSSQHSLKTIHPTYTIVVYEYDGNFLSISPNSHKQYPFIWNTAINVRGKKFTTIIFNSDMIHAGIINTIGEKRKVIQFKAVHKDDYQKLKHLDTINVDKISACEMNPFYESILRNLSFNYAFCINEFFNPFLTKKQTGVIGTLQDVFPIKFYNNSTV